MNDTVITVVGRIVNIPKRRQTEAGISVTNFRLASTARRQDRDSKQWVDGDTLFLNVSCWRQLADNVARSVIKGDPVIVRGRVFTRPFELDGQKRQSYDMEANAVGADLSWGQVEFSRTRKDVAPHDVIDGNDDETDDGPDDEPAEAGTAEYDEAEPDQSAR